MSIPVSFGKVEDEDNEDGDLFISSDGSSASLTEGDLNRFAGECPILSDSSILFSCGDLINRTCDPGDFLRFSVGGFSSFTNDEFRFNKDFNMATLLAAERLPTS